jgi:hypothetical protein
MNTAMTGTASALILGLLVASGYAALFHLIIGGPIRRLIIYLIAAWAGFAAGQLAGTMLNMDLFKLGTLHLLTASLGAWLALVLSWWLAGTRRP